jgi:hypothetical protein
MLVHQASYGLATEIHERAGLGQQQLLTSYMASTYFGVALPVVKANRMMPGEVIQGLETNIVAITGISLAGIPQPDNELHQISLLSSRHRMLKLDNINGQALEWLYSAFRQFFHPLVDFGIKIFFTALATHHRRNTFNNYQILSPAKIYINLFLSELALTKKALVSHLTISLSSNQLSTPQGQVHTL